MVTYLAVQETYYSELSLALVAAFGEGKALKLKLHSSPLVWSTDIRSFVI